MHEVIMNKHDTALATQVTTNKNTFSILVPILFSQIIYDRTFRCGPSHINKKLVLHLLGCRLEFFQTLSCQVFHNLVLRRNHPLCNRKKKSPSSFSFIVLIDLLILAWCKAFDRVNHGFSYLFQL